MRRFTLQIGLITLILLTTIYYIYINPVKDINEVQKANLEMKSTPSYHKGNGLSTLGSTGALFYGEKIASLPNVTSTVSEDCSVNFKDPSMALCHIIPWPNFGDELGPPVVRRILELHFGCSATNLTVSNLATHYAGGGDYGFFNRSIDNIGSGIANEKCLLSVGSLWRMVKSGDHVWGTGVAYDNTIKFRCATQKNENRVESITMYSSRGPLSASEIQQHCNYSTPRATGGGLYNGISEGGTISAAGDAGYLVPFLFPELIKKSNANVNHVMTSPFDLVPDKDETAAAMDTIFNTTIDETSESFPPMIKRNATKTRCIIPHKQDRHAKYQENWNEVESKVTLSVGLKWQEMISSLQDCHEVVSSSLHGIILAEALGIPSRRVVVSSAPGNFKFNDFYSSYRGGEPDKITRVKDAFDNVLIPLAYQERVNYAKRILQTFPFHLFHSYDV